MPEIILIEIDAALGRNEPDYEIRQLLKASTGLNLALDYLPGSTMFDPAARDIAPAEEASMMVWFDAFMQTLTGRREMRICWCGIASSTRSIMGQRCSFIMTGRRMEKKIASPFAEIEQHILLPWATEIAQAAAKLRTSAYREVLARIVEMVPDAWLEAIPGDVSAAERRAGYLDFFTRRLEASAIFEEEAIRAQSRLV